MNEGKQMTTAVIQSDASDKKMESEIFQSSTEMNCTTRQETQLIGPLTVQADELQFILNQLQCTINYHDEVIQTKFSAVEQSISSLHSELNQSFIRHESDKMIQSIKQDVCFNKKEGVSNTSEESAFHTVTPLQSAFLSLAATSSPSAVVVMEVLDEYVDIANAPSTIIPCTLDDIRLS
jgi:hypothetical protein